MGLELLEHPWKLSRVNLRNVVASGRGVLCSVVRCGVVCSCGAVWCGQEFCKMHVYVLFHAHSHRTTLHYTTLGLLPRANVEFFHSNVSALKTFDPFTHIYMFDVGWCVHVCVCVCVHV
jgi:hypothetical protein